MHPVAALSGLAAFAIGCSPHGNFMRTPRPIRCPKNWRALSRAMQNRFYFDEIYEATVIRIHDTIAAISDWIDRWIVLLHRARRDGFEALRLVQTGNLTYAFLFGSVVLWFVRK
jgi:hypothetical protein